MWGVGGVGGGGDGVGGEGGGGGGAGAGGGGGGGGGGAGGGGGRRAALVADKAAFAVEAAAAGTEGSLDGPSPCAPRSKAPLAADESAAVADNRTSAMRMSKARKRSRIDMMYLRPTAGYDGRTARRKHSPPSQTCHPATARPQRPSANL